MSSQTPVAVCPSSLIYTCVHVQSFSRVRFFVTSWTVACHPPPSMGISRQEYWSGLPFPPPGDLPNSGMEPVSLGSPALTGRFFTVSTTHTCVWKHKPILVFPEGKTPSEKASSVEW